MHRDESIVPLRTGTIPCPAITIYPSKPISVLKSNTSTLPLGPVIIINPPKVKHKPKQVHSPLAPSGDCHIIPSRALPLLVAMR